MNKVDELKAYVYENNPDLIFVDESWATDDIGDAEIQLEGYKIFRKDREQGRGGGCLIYAKGNIKLTKEEELNNSNAEALWCLLQTKNGQMLLNISYNSPSNRKEDERILEETIKKACNKYKNVLITGDFNHGSINWNTFEAKSDDKSFLDTTLECYLIQHVEEPTRGDNILDLVLSSNEQAVHNCTVVEPLGTSDHRMVEFDLICSIEDKDWKEEFFDFRKGNYEEMAKYLKSYDWSELYSSYQYIMDNI